MSKKMVVSVVSNNLADIFSVCAWNMYQNCSQPYEVESFYVLKKCAKNGSDRFCTFCIFLKLFVNDNEKLLKKSGSWLFTEVINDAYHLDYNNKTKFT